jgi:hypothetical protein
MLVDCAYIICIERRNNFVEDFFQFKPFFFEKTLFENNFFLQQKRFILFLPSLFSLALLWENREGRNSRVECLNFERFS